MKKIAAISTAVVIGSLLGACPALAGNTYQVVEQCHYPHGWNVTDFERDLQGTPNGRDHECLDTYQGMQRIGRRQVQDY